MKISVIIPVYNTENYLRKCIESVITQTYRDLEIIVIDDGSTDGSLSICYELAKTDSRIYIYEQENGGVSSARNNGLNHASGDWVSFLDSDDYLDDDFYETLVSAINENTSVICCGVRPVDENGKEVPHLHYKDIPINPIVLFGDSMWKHFLHPSKRYLYWAPWDKLIKASLAKKYSFTVGRKIGEDLYYCYQCLKEAGSIYYIPDKKYNYLIREGSATHNNAFSDSAFDSLFFSYEIFKETMNEESLHYYARLNVLVVASRIVRAYYKKADDVRQYHSKIECIRKMIRKMFRAYCIAELKVKQLCLIAEAAFIPAFFSVR